MLISFELACVSLFKREILFVVMLVNKPTVASHVD